MSLLQWLDHLDKTLFVLVQHDSDHSILDFIMPFLRDPLTWIPLYGFMAFYAFRAGKRSANANPDGQGADGASKAWAFILLSILTVAITDSVTLQVFKPLFGRLRPCHDPEMQPYLRGLSWIAADCIRCRRIMPPNLLVWRPTGLFRSNARRVKNRAGIG